MNIYLISQDKNNDYDTYDSAVVCAENEEEARGIHPYGGDSLSYMSIDTWAEKKFVEAKLIGTALPGEEKGVILASFNAG